MHSGSGRAAAPPFSVGTTSAGSPRASAPTSPSGARTASSSAGPPTRWRAWSSRGRTASTACTSAARKSSATGTSSAPTRGRSRASSGARRKDSRHERLALHPRARRRARAARERRARRALARRPRDGGRDRRRRADRRARRRPRARHLPPALPARLAVLQGRRHRSRARGGPLPRPAARLLLLVHDVPRQLTTDELAELFEGRTRLVEELAKRDDPLGEARDVIAQLSEEDKLGLRSVVFVDRRPKTEILEVLRQRLERTREEELDTAVVELVAIAEDRWRRS